MTRTMSTSTMTGNVPSIARSATSGNFTTVIARLGVMYSVWKERQALGQLDERTLRDLGLSTADVAGEASRTLTDIPANRY